jgi:hypothetical protein
LIQEALGVFLRGRGTNSPSQFGQISANFAVHSTQNVHSNEQINASPPGESGRSQCMHRTFISNAIFAVALLPALVPDKLTRFQFHKILTLMERA